MSPATGTPVATVVITTRNRREDLPGALRSCLTQDVPIEVLVIDDASTDGTADLVRSEFPWARLHVSEAPRGLVVQRNAAARMASAPVVISIDDDALFTAPDTVRRAVAALDDARIGAVAIPFCNVNQSPEVLQLAPDDRRTYVTAWFIGTAHAVRRDLFLEMGGYREFLHYQMEEIDFCYRLLDRGKFVRVITGSPIHHLVSPRRVRSMVVEYGERNRFLVATLNFPLSRLPRKYAGALYGALTRGWSLGMPMAAIRGIARGIWGSVRFLPQRKAISGQAFDRYQRLLARAATPLDDILSDA